MCKTAVSATAEWRSVNSGSCRGTARVGASEHSGEFRVSVSGARRQCSDNDYYHCLHVQRQ